MALFNDEKTPKGGKHIKGITCDVKNCIYHDGDAYCTADRIAVGPTYASSTSDTVCATFRAKQGLTTM